MQMRALLLYSLFVVVVSCHEFNNYRLDANRCVVLNLTAQSDYKIHLTISNGDAKMYVFDTNNYILHTRHIDAFYYPQVSVPRATNVINVDARTDSGNRMPHITHVVIESTNLLEPVYINGYVQTNSDVATDSVFLPKANVFAMYFIVLPLLLFLATVALVLYNCPQGHSGFEITFLTFRTYTVATQTEIVH